MIFIIKEASEWKIIQGTTKYHISFIFHSVLVVTGCKLLAHQKLSVAQLFFKTFFQKRSVAQLFGCLSLGHADVLWWFAPMQPCERHNLTSHCGSCIRMQPLIWCDCILKEKPLKPQLCCFFVCQFNVCLPPSGQKTIHLASGGKMLVKTCRSV